MISALRDGEATEGEAVEAASKAYAEATGYYVEFHKGLRSESSDKIRRGIRAALTAAALTRNAEPPVAAANPEAPAVPVVVSIKPMKLGDGRCDYFVSFKCGDREVTPHVFRERFKAEYHVAEYRWLFGQGDKPGIIEFSQEDWPAREFTDEERRAFAALVATPPAPTAAVITEFATAILHGDDEHRGWLLEAAEAFNAGRPMPEPRGKGTSPAPTAAVDGDALVQALIVARESIISGCDTVQAVAAIDAALKTPAPEAVALTGTVISDAMVDRALDGADYIPNADNRKWMRAALEAALSAPTGEGEAL